MHRNESGIKQKDRETRLKTGKKSWILKYMYCTYSKNKRVSKLTPRAITGKDNEISNMEKETVRMKGL